MIINKHLSVVSVSYNNSDNLDKTLCSVANCLTRPVKIVIVDGGSTDGTSRVVENYRRSLSIDFISGPDSGIYDAMNKGKRKVNTTLVHYLNAGDYLMGDPYANVNSPCLLPVNVKDDFSEKYWIDFVKGCGYGYCHQGIIFPVNHDDYDTRYDLSADFELICRTFPQGLNYLPVNSSGKVVYTLGGVSSSRSAQGKRQVLEIARENLPHFTYLKLLFYLGAQSVLPRSVRRLILRTFKSQRSAILGR